MEMGNPYTAPSEDLLEASPKSFYSAGQVAWATLLGSWLAGSWLLAMNYRRLGDSGSASFSLLLGFLGTVLIFVVAFYLPDDVPSLVLPIAYTLCMYLGVESLQGEALEKAIANGGTKGSGWVATGVGFLALILLCLILFGFVLLMPDEWYAEGFE